MATIILRQTGSIESPGSSVKGSPLTNLEVDNNFSNLNIEIGVVSDLATSGKSNLVVAVNELKGNVGTLSNLSTSGKSNLVVAINELDSNIGSLASLSTTAKDNLVAAINEVVVESTSAVAITGGTIIGVSNVSVAGNVYATRYFGDGSSLTGISVDSTRIISGTTLMAVTSSGGPISANIDGTQIMTINKDGASTANIRILGNVTSSVCKTNNLQDGSGRTLRILDESNTVIWGG